MLASDFPQRNALLGRPNDMTDEQCYTLPVHRYQDENKSWWIVSCWRPNREELQEIIRTGQIWVHTRGETLAPFSLHGENPFMDCQAWHFHPIVGESLEATIDSAMVLADEKDMPAEFFFNGVTMRVYPGRKVPVDIYVSYYKSKVTTDHFLNVIHQAHGRPVPKI